jgi:cell growth-regulating nucleolar protein
LILFFSHTKQIGTKFQSHTSCISEAEKYQKALYKPKKATPSTTTTESEKSKRQPSTSTDKSKPQPSTDSEKSNPQTKPRTESKHNPMRSIKDIVPAGKPIILSKVLKQLKKSHKADKKELLKKLVVEQNKRGELVLTLKA